MPCPEDNAIHAFVEGALSDGEREAIGAHLDACADCSALVEALQSAAPDNSLVGTVIAGSYRVLHRIGAGGMGAVFAAEHLRLERRVAIKVLSPKLHEQHDALQRFQREARICGMLGSRHIVDVLDFNQLPDGTPYTVMELLSGEDLAQRIALDGARPVARAIDIAQQICSALACTHAEGILHRDLKPANVFLCDNDGDGEGPFVKVLDFGISKARGLMATLTGDKEILGTPAYMSPEMANAEHGAVGPHSDLFALGAILYEMLCGRPAFSGKGVVAVLMAVVADDPTPPHDVDSAVPRALSELTMRLLEKKPAMRPQSADDVSAELSRIAKDLPLDEALAATVASGSDSTHANNAVPRLLDRRPAASTPALAASKARARWPRAVAVAMGVAAIGGVAVWVAMTRNDEASVATVAIAGGELRAGSTAAEIDEAHALCRRYPTGRPCDRHKLEREAPVRTVTVGTFRIDRYEVTYANLARWLTAQKATVQGIYAQVGDTAVAAIFRADVSGEHRPGLQRGKAGFVARDGFARQPAAFVTWRGSDRYCRDRGGTLPTADQWELAARGLSRRRFPWGHAPLECGRIVFARTPGGRCIDRGRGAVDVGTVARDSTPEGVRDLGGNVSEWVATPAPGNQRWRAFRGGSWGTEIVSTRGAARGRAEADGAFADLGFRCAYGSTK